MQNKLLKNKVIIKICLLFIFIFSACSYAAPTIADQKTIRILTDGGPGFGNQANSANVIAWLEHKGFHGTIEFIYPNMAAAKISTLFDLPAKLPDVYNFKYDNKIQIKFIKLKEHVRRLENKTLTPVDLGMTGAFDFSPCEIADEDQIDISGLTETQCTNFANFMNSTTFSRLNPSYLGSDNHAKNIYQFNQVNTTHLDNNIASSRNHSDLKFSFDAK